MSKNNPPLLLQLFGGLRLQREGQEPVEVPAQLHGVLLALLALNGERSYRREEIMERLWPEEEPERARQRLRNTLHTLRNLLDQPPLEIPEALLASRTTVGLNTALIRTDVAVFESALMAAAQARPLPEKAGHLREAIAVYRGDLLPGFYQEDIVQAQERLAERYESALRELTKACEQVGEREQAAAYARRAIELNPLLEEEHITLMRLYAAMGQPSNVLRQYQELERVLKEELDETPSEETRHLMETLRRSAQTLTTARTNDNAAPSPPTPEHIAGCSDPPIEASAPPAPSTPVSVSVPRRRYYWPLLVLGSGVLALLTWTWANRHPIASARPSFSSQASVGVPRRALPSANVALTPPSLTTPALSPQSASTLMLSTASPKMSLAVRRPSASLRDSPTTEREPRRLWVVRYTPASDERNDNIPAAMTTDAAGNIYITGFVQTLRNDVDFLTLKYSPEGKLLWRARYNGPGNDVDRAHSLAVDAEGNVYVTGESDNGKGNGLTRLAGVDFATIKYGPDGKPSPTWPDVGFGVGVRRYNGPDDGEDQPIQLCVSPQGEVYVTGWSLASRSTGDGMRGCREWATVKYGSDGTQLWARRESALGRSDGLLETGPTHMVLAPNGDLLITGNVQEDMHGVVNCDIETRRYAPDGSTVWSRRYGRPNNTEEMAARIVMDGSNAIYVTGITYRKADGKPDYNTKDILTLKYDAEGNEQWVQVFDYAHLADSPCALAVDRAGNVYIGGDSDTWEHNGDAAMLKYDGNGNLQWSRFHNGRGNHNDGVGVIALDSQGHVIFAGDTYDGHPSAGGKDWDYVIIKFDTNGRLLWKAFYDGCGLGEHVGGLAVDQHDNVIVTGSSDIGHNIAITTVKYAP